MWSRVVIIAFLAVIIYNLGAGLFYMFRDKGESDRMLKSLSWRIGLSVLLFVLLVIGFLTGVIQPHGVGAHPPH